MGPESLDFTGVTKGEVTGGSIDSQKESKEIVIFDTAKENLLDDLDQVKGAFEPAVRIFLKDIAGISRETMTQGQREFVEIFEKYLNEKYPDRTLQ